jgi:hypothetical protein
MYQGRALCRTERSKVMGVVSVEGRWKNQGKGYFRENRKSGNSKAVIKKTVLAGVKQNWETLWFSTPRFLLSDPTWWAIR